ncbi:MAG: hypothetical protein U0174_00490 [Polyangiaceae bacterium]
MTRTSPAAPKSRARVLLATLFASALAAVVLAAACGGVPEGGDCAVKVKCFSADCKTQVGDNVCICPEGSKTFDQCATPPADAGTKDATTTDGAIDAGQDSGSSDAATTDGSADAKADG